MTEGKLLQRLNHPDFYKSFLVLDHGSEIKGCILVNVIKRGIDWYSSDTGFISLIMVSPELRGKGFGKKLFERGLKILKKKQIKKVVVSYNPLTFWPGIDSSWVEAIVFFEEMGFREVSTASSMVTDLRFLTISENIKKREFDLREQKIMIRGYLDKDKKLLLKFIKKNFSYGWHEEVRPKIEKSKPKESGYGLDYRTLYNPKSVLVVFEENQIVGFSAFSINYEKEDLGHFGPTGIKENLRGKGIGTVLLFRTLEAMKNKGIKVADLWTNYKEYQPRHYYPKAGFRIVKKWITMEKKLD